MTLPFWILCVYCVGATLVLLRSRYHSAKDRELLGYLNEIKLAEFPPEKRLEILAKIEEIRNKQMPWYERSLSTVGVIAFFSMLVATGLQTTNANLSEAKIQRLQNQVEVLKAQQASLEPAVARAAQLAVEEYWARHTLENGTEEILRLRLSSLEKASVGGIERIAEMLDIALVLGDFKKALSLIEDNPDFVETAKPFQKVSIAECYFISGSSAHVSDILKRLEQDVSLLNSSLRFRVLVLKAALASNSEPFVQEAATLARTNSPDARARLQREIYRLRGQAQAFRL